MELIHVMFCCNDPDDGTPTGRVSAIGLSTRDSDSVSLGGPDPGPAFRQLDGSSFRLSRRTFDAVNWLDWCGNWCWNSAEMRPADVVAMIAYLRHLGGWQCDSAPSPFFGRWERGEPIGLGHLLSALGISPVSAKGGAS